MRLIETRLLHRFEVETDLVVHPLTQVADVDSEPRCFFKVLDRVGLLSEARVTVPTEVEVEQLPLARPLIPTLQTRDVSL